MAVQHSSEKDIESRLQKKVKDMGGVAHKIASATYTGLPDRMVMMAGGLMYWVELKSTGKTTTERQDFVHLEFQKLGFDVTVIDDLPKLNDFFARLRNDQESRGLSPAETASTTIDDLLG